MDFTEESASTAIKSLQDPGITLPSQTFIFARLLNRQVKAALKHMYEDFLMDLLLGLERECKSRERTSWAICLCTIFVLCMIVEELQMVFDGMVIYNIFRESEDPDQAAKSGTTCCRNLELVLTDYCWHIFFMKDRNYNPIKDGYPKDDGWQNQGEVDLFKEVREVGRDFGIVLPRPSSP